MRRGTSTYGLTDRGRENYSEIKMGYEPVGPVKRWRHRFYPDKIMTLPVGVAAGRDWEEVRP